MIFFHIILHYAVLIYDFRIFITSNSFYNTKLFLRDFGLRRRSGSPQRKLGILMPFPQTRTKRNPESSKENF